jgi:hypothetical protein
MVILLLVLTLAGSRLQARGLPAAVRDCIARHPEVSVTAALGPTYLTGHFVSKRARAYAIAVLENASHKPRVLICSGSHEVLLGRVGDPPFSDMDDDNYMSSRWRVCTRKAVLGMRRYYPDIPIPEQDAICFTWEDGEGLIYWDGLRFRWKSLVPR